MVPSGKNGPAVAFFTAITIAALVLVLTWQLATDSALRSVDAESRITTALQFQAIREAQGLNAQIEQTLWAKWSMVVGFLSTAVSIAALIALYRSLGQTNKTIKDNRELGEKQVRAYLSFASPKLEISIPPSVRLPLSSATHTIRISLEYSLKNSGQSPAHLVSLHYSGHWEKTGSALTPFEMLEFEPITPLSLEIEAGGLHKYTFDRQVKKHLTALISGEVYMRMAGKACYEDVFGQKHFTFVDAKVENLDALLQHFNATGTLSDEVGVFTTSLLRSRLGDS